MNMHFVKEEYKRLFTIDNLEQDLSLDTFTNSNHFHLPNVHFKEDGYFTHNFLDESRLNTLREKVKNIIYEDLLNHQSIKTPFELSKYHTVVLNEQIHKAISKWGIPISELQSHYNFIKESMESLLNVELTSKEIIHNGVKGVYAGCRIVRPNSHDHNPFHKDTWIENWKKTINVWLPLSGFNSDNGLQFIQKSHLFLNQDIYRTKSGFIIGDKTYHVPATVAFGHIFEILKPVLQPGQGLVFSPYLIHGNGVNNSLDETRVSLEFRFCIKE